MKELLELRQDYIIESKFKANTKKEKDNNGHPLTDWVDEKKEKAHGKVIVEQVCLFVPQPDNNGYETSINQKVYLGKDDILKLAKKIEEMESGQITGVPGDDLPF